MSAAPSDFARAGSSVDARSPADVYERNKTSLKDIVVHVAKDTNTIIDVDAAVATLLT